MSVAFADPSGLLVPHTSNAESDMIDSIRSECGFILQTVDWIARKLGYDLIGAIMDPIAGDFSSVDAMRMDWHGIAGAMDTISRNYASMADNVPTIWTGEAADAARARLSKMAEAHGTHSEAADLMAMQMANMLAAVTEACKLVAGVLGLLEELVLSFSLAKWAKEILTMGSGVRRAITLIDKAITFIKGLNNVIPPILKAAALMAAMFKALNMAFMLPMSAGQQADAANHIDDTAAAGW
ncbi:WXG100 family type VII secretion target [Nocardioides sp. LS1]|uniref:WXG100 family type VII secretion target n=1 Tax=Nocardioides sp. LS1 TaxID=1027620 RepID=UPI000F62265B|nr:hypothetical protein [Nocardioides sp. LS1]GCD89732.1 hypothetical protein NLS1_17380 [Nocardioides sp. LS1]